MAQIVLPFTELVDMARGARPFPKALESLRCEGDTIFVTVNPEASLPGFLKAVSPKVNVALQYRDFTDGTARFSLRTSVFSLSATRVIKLLLGVFSLPSMKGVTILAPKNPQEPPEILLELNTLIRERVLGVEVREFYLYNGEFIVVAQIENFKLLEDAPAGPSTGSSTGATGPSAGKSTGTSADNAGNAADKSTDQSTGGSSARATP